MGRRKIEIEPITHERNRSVTFLKRKNGLFKKAYELGVLCSVDVAVIIFEDRPSHGIKLYQYSSGNIEDIVKKHAKYDGEKDARSPTDFSGNKLDDADDGDDIEDEEHEPPPPPPSAPPKTASSKKGTATGDKCEPSSKAGPIDDDPDYLNYRPLTIPDPPIPAAAPLTIPITTPRISSSSSSHPSKNKKPRLELPPPDEMTLASLSAAHTSHGYMFHPSSAPRHPPHINYAHSHSPYYSPAQHHHYLPPPGSRGMGMGMGMDMGMGMGMNPYEYALASRGGGYNGNLNLNTYPPPPTMARSLPPYIDQQHHHYLRSSAPPPPPHSQHYAHAHGQHPHYPRMLTPPPPPPPPSANDLLNAFLGQTTTTTTTAEDPRTPQSQSQLPPGYHQINWPVHAPPPPDNNSNGNSGNSSEGDWLDFLSNQSFQPPPPSLSVPASVSRISPGWEEGEDGEESTSLVNRGERGSRREVVDADAASASGSGSKKRPRTGSVGTGGEKKKGTVVDKNENENGENRRGREKEKEKKLVEKQEQVGEEKDIEMDNMKSEEEGGDEDEELEGSEHTKSKVEEGEEEEG